MICSRMFFSLMREISNNANWFVAWISRFVHGMFITMEPLLFTLSFQKSLSG